MGPATWRRRAQVVIGLLLAVTPARADDLAAARLRFQRGEEHFRQERFQEAFDEYQAAYAAAPLPDFLFNMGQCQRKLGNRAAALELYRKFLETDPPPDRRAITEQVISEIQAEAPERAPPEEHHQPPAPPLEATPSVSRPVAPAVEPDRSGGRIRIGTWLLLGGSVALSGVAGAFALSAEAGQSDLDGMDCTRELERCFEARDDAERAFLLRNVFLVAGGAALAVTATLLVLDLSSGADADPAPNPDLALVLGPDALGLSGRIAW